jgi:1,4-dihydroxy-2-naphthoate octaprenyltransferase
MAAPDAPSAHPEPTSGRGAAAAPLTLGTRLAAWRYAFLTTNPPEQGVVDGVTRWLVVTRAGVLPMTLTSGLLAVLLAAAAPAGVTVDWLNVTLAVVGIVIAHLANNLMNDLADTQVGNDTENYPRALYAPHPILAGLVTKRQLVVGILLCQVLDLAIMATLIVRQDWWIAAFALGGLFLSYAYTAPPLRLKKIGLGELDVLLTWGPLMVGGVYYAGTGTLNWQVLVAATVYAILPVTVLMGKHIDKLPYDKPGRTYTFPVIVGDRAARVITQAMIVAFYLGIAALVATRALPWPAALVVLAVPRAVAAVRAYSRPKPTEAPPDNPVWPLYWAPIAFLHTRRAGGLLILGLAGWAIWVAVR